MSNKKKITVLISAHEFSPYQGSECAVGWNIVLGLAQRQELNLIVLYASGSQNSPESYRNALVKYKKDNEMPSNIIFYNVDQPKFTLFLHKVNMFFFKRLGGLGLPVLYYIGYKLWQRKSFLKAKDICEHQRIDLIHNLTQISFREPGYYYKLNVPFIWGPIGGFSFLPYGVLRGLPFKDKVFEFIRNISNFYQIHFKSRVRKALKKAELIYLISEIEKKRVLKINSNLKFMVETGISFDGKPKVRSYDGNRKLKIIWVGRLENRKSLDVLFKALKKIHDVNDKVSLIVLGNGPLREAYEDEIRKLNLSCVKLLGKVAHKEVKEYLKASDVMVHTSYREGTPHSVLEAIDQGLPVICHNIGGLSSVIDSSNGIKIELVDKEYSVNKFYEAVSVILEKPIVLEELSYGALKKRDKLSWKVICEKISEDYSRIFSSHEDNEF